MIPTLLWRCPLCLKNEALIQDKKIFRPWYLRCSNCGTVWKVRRVVGEDYLLKVIESDAYKNEIGTEQPLAKWYARLKESFKLSTVSDPTIKLDEGENLYLVSKSVELRGIANDPIFFPDYEEPEDGEKPVATLIGKGRVFLTDRRFGWLGEDGMQHDFPLARTNSVYTIFNIGIVFMFETSLYIIKFEEESLLMWVTYFAHVGKVLKEKSGHGITTSKY
jgi:hypothetical protein